MTTDKLIDSLASSGMVSADVVANLRQRMLESWQGFAPADVIRWLVVEGHVTAAQGDRLLRDAEPISETIAASRDAISNPYEDLEVLPDDEEDDVLPPLPAESMPNVGDGLELLPLDEQPRSRPAKKPPSVQPGAGKPSGPGSAPGPAASPSRTSRSWRSEVRPASPAKPAAASQGAAAGASASVQSKPIDDLLGDALLTDVATDAGPSTAAARRSPLGGPSRGAWDSPLMLIGGGVLALLLIGVPTLVWLLNRGTADEALKAAEDDYHDQSFAQAIHKFDYYLEHYPNDSKVGLARVHRGLAQLRQAVESSAGNWPPALDVANEVVVSISTEDEFHDAQGELASLLPNIAEGLAKQAEATPSQALVDQSRQALALVEKYVPAPQRDPAKQADIEASLAVTTRRLDRDNRLAAAIEDIRKAVSEGATARGYAARKQLLKQYPDLASSKPLHAAVLEITKAEQTAVKFVPDARPAEKADVASPVKASLALAVRGGSPAPEVQDAVVLALAEGAVYGLDAASGQPLWRRFVGFDVEFAERRIPGRAGGDAVLADAVRNEIIRVDARSGAVRWRQAAADPFDAQPVLLRDRVLVSTRSGRLLSIDVESGEVKGYVQLPQRLTVGAAVDPREQHYYQLAEHSNLYVLSAAENRCAEVLHLGHEPGTIDVPPLAVGRYLFVVENNGAEDSVLRVLLTSDQGLEVAQVEQVPLRGHVRASPRAAGRTLLVATDRGALYTFEIAAAGQTPVLTKTADKPADDLPPIVRFPVLQSGEMWVAGPGLVKYDVQSARGRLAPKWIDDDRDVLLYPPEIIGRTIFYARKRRDLPGVVVSAANGDDGKRFWETQLSVPLAGAPLVDSAGASALALSTLGALFDASAERLAARAVLDQPTAGITVTRPLSADARTITLKDDRTILAAIGAPTEGKQAALLVVDPAAGSERIKWLPLADEPLAPPAAFRGGLLVPTRVGQILAVDAVSGRNLVEPFQPRLEAGRAPAWTEPASTPDGGALVCDGTKLYRLAVADRPAPHLAAAAEAAATSAITSPVAVLEKTAYAVDDRKQLLAFELPDLAAGKSWPLTGSVAWGPRRIGDVILLATGDQLLCLDGGQNLRWQVALEYGPLAGEPLRAGDAILLASSTGTVYRLAADSGKEIGKTELGQPLAAGPLAWRDGLLVVGHDGTLLVVASP